MEFGVYVLYLFVELFEYYVQIRDKSESIISATNFFCPVFLVFLCYEFFLYVCVCVSKCKKA